MVIVLTYAVWTSNVEQRSTWTRSRVELSQGEQQTSTQRL
jgi:hypothetical protein